MTHNIIAVAVIFALGGGLLLSWRHEHHHTMMSRIAPFVGIVKTPSSVRFGINRFVAILFMRNSLALWGTDRAISKALQVDGSESSLGMFRTKQLFHATVFTVVTGMWATLRNLTHGGQSNVTLLITVLSFPAGGWFAQWSLHNRISKRARCAEGELPDFLELLAFAVSAGEPLLLALKRICRMTAGVLSGELEKCLAMVNAGSPLSDALVHVEESCGSELVSRAMRALLVALDRGTPIAEVLRAQANDARAHRTRDLIVLAGKKESAMLAPVVFFVLPMIVAVAIYPGLLAMRVL